ncbi:hypothetical protein Pint_04970 [Pistacia integerrima]|uniref:Uncharacterized protein n=1 Tax=Pistacia integerrima TaxID=434235 RepID=A0ACC0Z3K2_9ROSI|nr:hypothetical protein Pint_04970 [Pistacia integerrima]
MRIETFTDRERLADDGMDTIRADYLKFTSSCIPLTSFVGRLCLFFLAYSVGVTLQESSLSKSMMGRLKDGKIAAIKVLSAESRQGVREFLTEIQVISEIQHENLVKLYGCCVEGNHRILVYNFLENNSLAQTLLDGALFITCDFFCCRHGIYMSEGNWLDLVDASLNGDFDAEQACRFLKIALLCTQDTPKLRPTMSSVVKMLTGEKAVNEKKITKPGLITDFMDLKVRGPQNTQMEPKNTSPDNSSDNPDTPNLSSEATSYSTFNTNDRST